MVLQASSRPALCAFAALTLDLCTRVFLAIIYRSDEGAFSTYLEVSALTVLLAVFRGRVESLASDVYLQFEGARPSFSDEIHGTF